MAKKIMTGAEAAVQALIDCGVETCFGYPGGAILPFYDRIIDSNINHILVRHEQGALHMADGYARVKGKPGVAIVTSGPGGTNAVTGLANALMDSIPLVCISGQVPTALIGNDAFQEADIVGITRSATKHNYLVKDVNDLQRIIHEAFYIASSGRPGPVLIDLPKDVQNAEVEYAPPTKKIEIEGYHPVQKPTKASIDEAIRILEESERPVLYTGGGVLTSRAHTELRQLAEAIGAPVTNTLMGLSAFPANHELWMGMLGMHGTYTANMAVSNSDVLFAIGSRFDDRVTGNIEKFAVGARIIHIDIDPTSISKNIAADLALIGDAKSSLKALVAAWKAKKSHPAGPAKMRKAWLKQIHQWKKDFPLTYETKGKKIRSQHVIRRLCELTRGEAIVTTEVGQHQMWAAQFYDFVKPNHFITSGGLGTMGFGLPAAIGAQMAAPDQLVVDIAGDASIQMVTQEIATAVQYDLPVKVLIINNAFLGMVRQWQELFYQKRYAHSDMMHQPDFVKLAEAYGATGLRAEKPEELDGVLKKMIKTKGCVVVDIKVEKEDNVYPMVPAGAALDEMVLV